MILGKINRQLDEERQSKSFRAPITNQHEEDRMQYYKLNDRLKEEPRKLTP
jgi:hypothetical protein